MIKTKCSTIRKVEEVKELVHKDAANEIKEVGNTVSMCYYGLCLKQGMFGNVRTNF